jgi:hypothetical protein
MRHVRRLRARLRTRHVARRPRVARQPWASWLRSRCCAPAAGGVAHAVARAIWPDAHGRDEPARAGVAAAGDARRRRARASLRADGAGLAIPSRPQPARTASRRLAASGSARDGGLELRAGGGRERGAGTSTSRPVEDPACAPPRGFCPRGRAVLEDRKARTEPSSTASGRAATRSGRRHDPAFRGAQASSDRRRRSDRDGGRRGLGVPESAAPRAWGRRSAWSRAGG